MGWASALMAGPVVLAERVPAHLFMVEIDGDLCPVVDVEANDRIVVLKRDQSRVTLRHERVGLLPKQLSPVGRVTVCESEGLSYREGMISNDFVYTSEELTFDFKLVADRDLSDVYVVLFYGKPDRRGSQAAAFAKFKDLPAGSVVTRSAVFPNVTLPQNTRYRFELYSHGLPIEMLYLNRVAAAPRSHGLLIPWEERIRAYRGMARESKASRSPSAFVVTFTGIDTGPYQENGIDGLRLEVRVRDDGTAKVLSGFEPLNERDRIALLAQVPNWRFFPEVKKGRLKEGLITLPIRF